MSKSAAPGDSLTIGWEASISISSGSADIMVSGSSNMGSVSGSMLDWLDEPVYVDGPMYRNGNSSSRGSRAWPRVPSTLRFVVTELARDSGTKGDGD